MKRVVALAVILLALAWSWNQSKTVAPAHAEQSRVPAQVGPAIPAVPEPMPVSAASPSLDEFSKARLRWQNLQACYESQSCAFPQTDARAYEFALGRALADELKSMRSRFAAHPELAGIAREAVRSLDPHVQSTGLAILASFPPSSENLTAIAEGVESSPDPLLVQESLAEFRRYLGRPEEPAVHAALSTMMIGGAHFVSQAVALGLSPFLNASSFPVYLKSTRQISAETTTGRDLRAALREYQMKISGG